MRHILLIVLALGLAWPVGLEAITMDFNTATPGQLLHSEYVEAGFRVDVLRGHYDLFEGTMQIDTYAGGRSTIRLDAWGAPFHLLGLDVVNWEARSDHLAVDEVAFVTSSLGGRRAITDAGPLRLTGPQWANISWIQFDVFDPNHDTQQDNFRFDNLRLVGPATSQAQRAAAVNVPEPLSLLLVGLGLAALVGARRFRVL